MFCFALIAGYPERMVLGTLLAGAGALAAASANALLVRLTVELRNAALALVDFARQLVTLIAVALLVAAGARLTAFFAVMIAAGLAMLVLVPVVGGRGSIVRPRLDRPEQRRLIATALPLAIALGVGQVYFRVVIVLMSLISSVRQTGYFGGSLRAMESLVNLPILVIRSRCRCWRRRRATIRPAALRRRAPRPGRRDRRGADRAGDRSRGRAGDGADRRPRVPSGRRGPADPGRARCCSSCSTRSGAGRCWRSTASVS